MPETFIRRVIFPNRWRYLVVVVICFAYAFVLPMRGPKWYKAEATLAFKNRSGTEQLNITRLSSNPLPIFLDEAPIEQTYELSNIIYSVNMANRVIGDRFDELYADSDSDSVIGFYEDFLLLAGFDYDGDRNVVTISYTYKDPEIAAEFCNGFAAGLEEFMVDAVDRTHISSRLMNRLDQARREAATADAEVNRIAELHGVPDLLVSPVEWIKAYSEAMERQYVSEAETRSILAALEEIRKQRGMRDLLDDEPAGVPDTTIVQDIILGGLRFRLAIIRSLSDVAKESLNEDGITLKRYEDEAAFLETYLEEQYRFGLDVETQTLLIKLQEKIVENYLYKVRADETYKQIERLPMLEAEIRPALRASNVAKATVASLERLTSLIEIGEEYGVHPIKSIDSAVVPTKPLQPGWSNLAHVLPTMLFLATLWFALAVRMVDEAAVKKEHEFSHKEES